MYQKIVQIFKTETLKDVSIMTIATGISALLAALFFILVARLTNPEKLGIFSLATAASFMFADIFDVALNASLVRFVSRELNKEKSLEDKYLKFVFKLKILVAIGLIVLIFFFKKPISKLVFGNPLEQIILLVGVGTGFHLIFTFTIAHLQARKLFFKAAQSLVLLPTIRLIGLLIVVVLRQVTVVNLLYAYFVSTLLAIIPVMLMAPRKYFQATNEYSIARKFFRYNLPLTTGFSLSAVSGRVDNFILANLASSVAVGFYSAAFRLFSPLQFLVGSLATVFAPRFASFSNKEQAKIYLKKTILLAITLTSLLLLAYPLAPFIIRTLFGDDFLPSVPSLRILLFGFSIFSLQTPFISVIMYYFSKPKVFALISLVQLILIITLNLLFIPRLAQVGAALAFLVTQIIILIFIITYVLRKMNELDHE
jgi:O-antigen/teichoic acid export membrane protein